MGMPYILTLETYPQHNLLSDYETLNSLGIIKNCPFPMAAN